MRAVRHLLPRIAILPIALGLVVGCSSNDSNPTAPGGGGGGGTADVVINIVANNGANSFSPNPDTVLVGQTVSWKNQDTATHTATADTGPAFSTGNIAPSATSSPIAMNTAGSYPYHCGLHPSMTGTLVVKP